MDNISMPPNCMRGSTVTRRTEFAVQPGAGSCLAYYAIRTRIEVVHARKHVAATWFSVECLVLAAHVFASWTAATLKGSERSICGVTIV